MIQLAKGSCRIFIMITIQLHMTLEYLLSFALPHGEQIKNDYQKSDFLVAETLPAVPEAKGIAQAMSKTDVPYMICFFINRN